LTFTTESEAKPTQADTSVTSRAAERPSVLLASKEIINNKKTSQFLIKTALIWDAQEKVNVQR
jgi:hypothetical protein